MRRKQRRQLKQTMATDFPSLSRNRDVSQNVYMFTQDIPLAVMPIGGKAENHEDFNVKLKGTQSEFEIAKQLIADIGKHDRRDLKENVCGAVEQVVQRLAWEGRAAYEILRDEDGIFLSLRIYNETPVEVPEVLFADSSAW